MVREGLRSGDKEIAGLQVIANIGEHANFKLAAIDLRGISRVPEQSPPAFACKAQRHGLDRNPIGASSGWLSE